MDRHKLFEELKVDEGVCFYPYRDTVGKLTIGVGRNLDDRGISISEICTMLDNDIENIELELDREFPWWRELSDNRQRALANMCFNLGITKFRKFRKMIAALEQENYPLASYEAINSIWAGQVGARAERIADLIRQG